MQPLDPVGFPDPFAPISCDAPAEGVAQATSLERQRRRRAEIHAATRRMLAEEGHERLTLRRVSEECGVAVQTVRNGFGRREELIVSAVNEHASSIWRRQASRSAGPSAFLDFGHVIHRCAMPTPAFLRGTLAIAFSNDPSLITLQRHASDNKTRLLRTLKRPNGLRPGIDVAQLAAQIIRLGTMPIYERRP